MELFPATNAPQWNHIKKEIEGSDYYVLIVGGRYGSIDQETGLSYTHMEYLYAKELKKCILCFLLNPKSEKYQKDAQVEGKDILSNKQDFLAEVQRRLCCVWNDKTELVRDVIISLYKTVMENKEQGWIRDGKVLLGKTEKIENELVEKETDDVSAPLWKRLLNYRSLDSQDEFEKIYNDVIDSLESVEIQDSTALAAITYTLNSLSMDEVKTITPGIKSVVTNAYGKMLRTACDKEELYNIGLNFHRTLNWLQGEKQVDESEANLVAEFDGQYAEVLTRIRNRMVMALEELTDDNIMRPLRLLNEAVFDHSVTYEFADIFNEVDVDRMVDSVTKLQTSSIHKISLFFIERYKLRFYMEDGHLTYQHLAEVPHLESLMVKLTKRSLELEQLRKVAMERLIKVVGLSVKRADGDTSQLMEYNE